MADHLTLGQVLTAVHDVDAWLDGAVADAYQGQPLAQDWARVAKVIEETGEAIAELILWTGQNPRKGTDPEARDRLLKELGDVVMTAMFAIQHFTGDVNATWTVISAALEKAASRAIER